MMKQYFIGFFTATCLTTSLFLFTGAQKANTQSEPIVIKSERGTTTIGGGFIEVDGASGKKLFEVAVSSSNHGQLSVFNKNGVLTTSVSAGDDGDGFVRVHNNNGVRAVDISSSSFGGYFSTYNLNKKQTSYIGTFRNLRGGLMTYNENADLTSFVGTSDESDGKISLYNNMGNNVVRMGSLYKDGNKADGFISLHDRYGEYGWHKSGK